jgi:hypothetical protein
MYFTDADRYQGKFKQDNQAQFNAALCGLYCLGPYITTSLSASEIYTEQKRERDYAAFALISPDELLNCQIPNFFQIKITYAQKYCM